jgi:hypothetical protein
MLKRHHLYLIILFTSTACLTVDKKGNDNSDETNLKTDTLVPNKISLDRGISEERETFGEPIDILVLKGQTFLTVTSGVWPHSESKTFCKSSDHRFFGHYQLIDKSDEKFEFIGQLIVSVPNSAEGWTFDNNYETFVEIKLESNKIRIWNELGVGNKETHLIKFIGDNFSYKKGTTIYAELGDYSLNATILGDTINKLTVGKYCK